MLRQPLKTTRVFLSQKILPFEGFSPRINSTLLRPPVLSPCACPPVLKFLLNLFTSFVGVVWLTLNFKPSYYYYSNSWANTNHYHNYTCYYIY